jgi:regulatory protein YycI of two-component signal transduction system YycFG
MDIHTNILLEINILECEAYKYGLSKSKSKRLAYLQQMENNFVK